MLTHQPGTHGTVQLDVDVSRASARLTSTTHSATCYSYLPLLPVGFTRPIKSPSLLGSKNSKFRLRTSSFLSLEPPCGRSETFSLHFRGVRNWIPWSYILSPLLWHQQSPWICVEARGSYGVADCKALTAELFIGSQFNKQHPSFFHTTNLGAHLLWPALLRPDMLLQCNF